MLYLCGDRVCAFLKVYGEENGREGSAVCRLAFMHVHRTLDHSSASRVMLACAHAWSVVHRYRRRAGAKRGPTLRGGPVTGTVAGYLMLRRCVSWRGFYIRSHSCFHFWRASAHGERSHTDDPGATDVSRVLHVSRPAVTAIPTALVAAAHAASVHPSHARAFCRPTANALPHAGQERHIWCRAALTCHNLTQTNSSCHPAERAQQKAQAATFRPSQEKPFQSPKGTLAPHSNRRRRTRGIWPQHPHRHTSTCQLPLTRPSTSQAGREFS